MRVYASIAVIFCINLSISCAFTSRQLSARIATRQHADLAAIETTSSVVGGAKLSGLTSEVATIFTSEQIDAILPHRYPFALVDKVVEYEAGKRAVGVKCVTKVSD